MRRFASLRTASAILCAVFVIGCTPAQQVALDSGVRGAQRAKDAEARILKVSICAMSIGAYHRINSDLEKRAVDVLCGGI